MNGFANSILSFMLNWIRALISALWRLFSGEGGVSLYGFLAQNWLGIVIVLCVGGVLVDLLVYFFRWRPDYVWRSRLHRRDEDEDYEEPYEAPEMPQPKPEPIPEPVFEIPVPPMQQPTRLWAPVTEEELAQEEPFLWDAEEPLDLEWETDEAPAFGAAKPEPAHYYRDMSAGYAPPVPPEQLYQPSASYRPPVHPGLDEEAVRQTFAIQKEEYPPEQTPLVVHAPAFRPFTVQQEEPQLKPTGALSRFAKRMGDLVGVADEDHQPSFRDLQSTVDVSQAFHAPVYPQPMNHKEG